MNCIAIDDEPLALDIISEFCSKISNIDLIGTFTNPFDAVELLNSKETDLIFLDIHIPQINGFEFLKLLYKPPLIIFATAFREHAFQGFEYDAVDYLVKPFSFDRFAKSVNKAQQIIALRESVSNISEVTERNSCGFIMIKVEYSTIRVNLDDILYIEGLKDYVKIYTGGKPILTKNTMKNFINKLPSNRFFRVHKSFIISIDKINKIENCRIMIDNQRIPIGESYKQPFYKIVTRNSL
jgi:DNA-binding LytR/AlgR family response regulator